MCRNIKPLFNYAPPVTDEEIYAAALQYVRKVSGFTKPSGQNKPAFDSAVTQIAQITHDLMEVLETTAPPRNRAAEIEKARARAQKRFV